MKSAVMKFLLCVLMLLLCFLPHISLAGESFDASFTDALLPSDFYAYNPHESVNTYTGALSIHQVDLSIPGNGGLDIVIDRVYQTGVADERGQYHWLMHPGWIVRHDVSGQKHDVRIDAHGILHELLQKRDGTYFTTDGWYGEYGTFERRSAFILTAPNGTVYIYEQRQNSKTIWNLVRVEDVHGNWLTYTYQRQINQMGGLYPVQSIRASDGRAVDFSDGGCIQGHHDSLCTRLMTANGQTWRYEYHPFAGGGLCLTRVVRPDGTGWLMDYRGNLLSRLTLPQGGYSEYLWTVHQDVVNKYTITPALALRRVYKADGTLKGTWTHTQVRSAKDPAWQRHTIAGPEKTRVYHHYDILTPGNLWKLGTLQLLDIYDGDKLLSQIHYDWIAQQIAWRPYILDHYRMAGPDRKEIDDPVSDNHTYVARLSHKTITLGDKSYQTTYQDFDEFGHAQHVVQQDSDGSQRSIDTHYFNNTQRHIHSLWQAVLLNGEESASRSYNDLGDVMVERHFAVETNFTYTPEGDLATRTDANGHTQRYSDYYRGKAQVEILADGSRLTRAINAPGTVASRTDARGNATRFTYDGLNRLTSIEPAQGEATHFVYNGAISKTLTRGNYQKETRLDDFGLLHMIKERDQGSGQTRIRTFAYDADGREVFHSYLSDAQSSYGIYTTYDALDRVVGLRFPYPGSAQRSYRYPNGNQMWYTDERANETLTEYRAYGDPAQHEVMAVYSAINRPEHMSTVLTRDVFGHVLSVTQGEVMRTYTLDAHKFVASMSNPETGTTQYTRDNVGHVIEKQVGASDPIHFTYDARDRLTRIDNPDDSITMAYDADDNLIMVKNRYADNRYTYDANNNRLRLVSLLDNGTSLALNWTYDVLDHVVSLQYPSGRVLDYAPNAFGKATRVSDMLTGIQYHANGQLQSLHRGNGIDEAIDIDSLWQLPLHQRSSINDIAYTYDEARNITSISDALDSAYAVQMTYDGLHRVATMKDYWGEGVFTYDGSNNITLMRHGNCATSFHYRNNVLQSTAGCKPATYQYDARGNMISKSSPIGGGLSLTFDDNNRLRDVNGDGHNLHYYYDGLGSRIKAIDGTKVTYALYDKTGRLLVQSVPDGMQSEYYYLDDQRVAASKYPAGAFAERTTTFYHWDVLGNIIAATSVEGQLLWRRAYQAFGLDIRGQVHDNDTPGFVSKAYNQDTGLSYFGQRYYAPALGRFISMDPVAFEPDKVFSFNRYAYGNNNPYRYKDVDGRNPFEAIQMALTVGRFLYRFIVRSIKVIRKVWRSHDKKQSESPENAANGTQQGVDVSTTVDDLIKESLAWSKNPGRKQQFEMPGGIAQASQYFAALNPVGVKEVGTQLGQGKEGMLPDGRRIVMKPGGQPANSRPMLEIEQGNNRIQFLFDE